MAVHPSLNVYFSSLARRPVKTMRIFCETSHRNSKSDGLGGVVKAFASRAAVSERCVIRGAKELTDFFDKTLEGKSTIDSNRPMLNRLFFLHLIERHGGLQRCLSITQVQLHL